MTDRTAIDTIRGYFYQFDYSIISLLNLLNGTDSILIEGIEDVDISTATETTAVQCKYYESTEYNHSIIKKPIMLMLDHFKQVKNGAQSKINYKLKGHYKSGHSKLTFPISVQNLKDNFLTYTRTEKIGGVDTKVKHYHHEEIILNDDELQEFISLLEIDINAVEFEIQFQNIISLLKTTFNCSDFSAEFHFYNNALRVIRDISKDPNPSNRNITKADFLERINNSKILFNEWYVSIKGEKSHYAKLRKQYFENINILSKDRYFIFEVDQRSYSRNDIKTLLYLIIKNYAKIKNQPSPFCPYIYIHDITEAELIELKKDLIEDDIVISDGYDFQGADFNAQSILKKPTLSHQIKLKFLNKIEHLNQIIDLTSRRSEIYQFYLNDIFFDYTSDSIKHLKIQLNNLDKIKHII